MDPDINSSDTWVAIKKGDKETIDQLIAASVTSIKGCLREDEKLNIESIEVLGAAGRYLESGPLEIGGGNGFGKLKEAVEAWDTILSRRAAIAGRQGDEKRQYSFNYAIFLLANVLYIVSALKGNAICKSDLSYGDVAGDLYDLESTIKALMP